MDLLDFNEELDTSGADFYFNPSIFGNEFERPLDGFFTSGGLTGSSPMDLELGDILEVEMLMMDEEEDEDQQAAYAAHDEFLASEMTTPSASPKSPNSSMSVYIPESPPGLPGSPALPILQSMRNGHLDLPYEIASSGAAFSQQDSVVAVGVQRLKGATSESMLFVGHCAKESIRTIRKTFTVATEEKVRRVEWSQDQAAIVFSAGAKIGVISRESTQNVSWITCGHEDEIRDLSLNTNDSCLSCGFDGKLTISDVTTGTQLMSASIGNVLGSCKWYNDNVASATTDCGDWFTIDTRAKPGTPALSLPNVNVGLYAHTFFQQGMLCLGFGHGKVITMDLRALDERRPVFECQDPAVFSIGEMKTSAPTNSIVVTGEDSLTVYRGNPDGSLSVLARGKRPEFGGSVGLQTKAHISADTGKLFVTDSTASINMYQL